MKARLLLFSIVFVAAAVAAAVIFAAPLARVPSAYVAKTLCSEIFVAGRDEAAVRQAEFGNIHAAIDNVSARVDAPEKAAHASLFGLGRASAIYREGLGCTIKSGPVAPAAAPSPAPGDAWREAISAKARLARVDYAGLARAFDEAMGAPDEGHRALLVIADGRVVGERYAEGFGPDTPFLSWSMAKSLTATLVGAAVLRGHIALESAPPVPEWRGDDARASISWDDLLRMQSGLAFDETYADPSSDINRMLFDAHDAGAAAAAAPLHHPPGERWSYSSGSTNIVSRALRAALERDGVDYHSFPARAIFGPVGASSAVMEVDSAGNFVGSSYAYMTARDWARIGQLYLQDGVWNGARLLPEGWSAYVSEPTPESDGQYGAHMWLNRDGESRERFMPGVPDDAYYFAGHDGQYVFIIPSLEAVIVRTGITRGEIAPLFVVAPTIERIARALGPPSRVASEENEQP